MTEQSPPGKIYYAVQLMMETRTANNEFAKSQGYDTGQIEAIHGFSTSKEIIRSEVERLKEITRNLSKHRATVHDFEETLINEIPGSVEYTNLVKSYQAEFSFVDDSFLKTVAYNTIANFKRLAFYTSLVGMEKQTDTQIIHSFIYGKELPFFRIEEADLIAQSSMEAANTFPPIASLVAS